MARLNRKRYSQRVQLPADVLSVVFSHLPRKDLAAVRQVCRLWNSQVLQDVQSIHLSPDPCPAAVSFLNSRLPALSSLSLSGAESVFGLHMLTKQTLTGLTIR